MNLSTQNEITSDCLWMQAGVVRKKKCDIEFACNTCSFDQAMTRVCRENEAMKKNGIPLKGKRAKFLFWTDKLLKAPLARRPCIHHMKGHIGFKNCTRSYHCIDCEFEQYFYDQFKVHTVLNPVEFDNISGIFLPTGYYLHPGHTWIKIEDQGMVRIGIDDFAVRLLGNFDTLSTPLIGEKLKQGKSGFTFSRQGHEVSFACPVNGIVTDVNSRLYRKPDLTHQDPYTDGWVLIVYCPTLKQDLKQLFFMDSSKGFMGKEIDRLYEFLEAETQVKAADGGTLVSDIFGNLPGVSWEKLLKKFIPQDQDL